MPRYQFHENISYAGRLLSVRKRPIENWRADVTLLRLEFEVFLPREEKRVLDSLRKIACRDLIVMAGAADDQGVAPFSQALAVAKPARWQDWMALEKSRPWVTIEFGPADAADERNAFRRIVAFDASDWRIDECDHRLGANWVRTKVAAKRLKVGDNTVRRHVQRFESEWGGRLVTRTKGGHRQINLLLLRHLIEETK